MRPLQNSKRSSIKVIKNAGKSEDFVVFYYIVDIVLTMYMSGATPGKIII